MVSFLKNSCGLCPTASEEDEKHNTRAAQKKQLDDGIGETLVGDHGDKLEINTKVLRIAVRVA